ncbi:BZ3500_MvSof-1268-A1-R1_Chr2-1g04530 [Microbotryum saponariae]|uniref:BZ3500_MvSof-1268-A1-R1_Chr2-1g04530 protein n=1 Tax=Microbotryum saponariae TaxID=289078 RepID=A0A2X0KJQ1_9BASI|nr:BZ3500_MvSof-1268-A1-R1_Chr2-1g04530 [Microbotryum saponariae]SCZ91938.1 BZ3501_MvSof-1269-A2-R1_Chr2-1g04186 [Microbotryum saponariae]
MASDPISSSSKLNTPSYTASLASSSAAAPSDEPFLASMSGTSAATTTTFSSSVSPMANPLLDDDDQHALSGWARTLQYSPQIFPTLYSSSLAHSDSGLGNFGLDLGDSAMMAGPSSFKSVVGFADSPLLGPSSRSNIGDGLGSHLQPPSQPTNAANGSMLPSGDTSLSDFDSFASSFNFDSSLFNAVQTPQTIEEIHRLLNEVALTTPALSSTIANGLSDPILQTPPRPKDDSEIRAYAKLEFATSDFYIQKLSVVVGRRPAAAMGTSASPAPLGLTGNGSSIKLEDFSMEAGETQILLREGTEAAKGDTLDGRNDASTSETSIPVPQIEVTPNSPGPSIGASQPQFATGTDISATGPASTSKPNGTTPIERQDSNLSAKGITTPALADIDLGPIRAVSRHHARIYFSEKKGRWKVEVLGRNGVVVDGQWKGKGERATLKHRYALRVASLRSSLSGSFFPEHRTKVQIAERVFHFVLPAAEIASSLEVSPEKKKKKATSKNRASGERAGSEGESEGHSSSSLSDVSESDIELSPLLDTKTELVEEATTSNTSPSKIRLTLSLGPGSRASTPDSSKGTTSMAPPPPRKLTPSASPAAGATGSGAGGGLGKGSGRGKGGKGVTGGIGGKGGKSGMVSMHMGGKGGKGKGMGKTIIPGKTKFPHGLVRADAGSDSSSDSDSDDDSDKDSNTTAIAGASSDDERSGVLHVGKGPGKMPLPRKAPRKHGKTTTEPAPIALKQLTPSTSTPAPISNASTATATPLPTLPDPSLFASLPDLPTLPSLPGEAHNATAGKTLAQLPTPTTSNGTAAPIRVPTPSPAPAPAPIRTPALNTSAGPATSPAAAVDSTSGPSLVRPPTDGAIDSASATADSSAPPPSFVPKPPTPAYVAAAADPSIPTSRLPHTPAPILKAPPRHAPFQPAPMPEGDPPHEAPAHDRNMKPPYTYGSLIAQAVSESEHNKMTMSQVYDWIDRRWPFFRDNQPGWQNSVRHNLTPARGFVKIDRRPDEPGKGAFWTVDPAQLSNFDGLHYRKKNLGGATRPKPAAPPVMGSFAPTSGSTTAPTATPTSSGVSAPSTNTGSSLGMGINAGSAITRPPPPNPPSTGPALSVPLPIVVGPIPETYVRPTPPPSSAPPDEITAALLRDPPIVLHEGKLIINPIIFAHLSKEQLANLETLPASNALQILQAYVVQHFKEKMKRIADEKAAAKARAEKAAAEKLAAEKLVAEAAAAKKALDTAITSPSPAPTTTKKAGSPTPGSKDAPKKPTAAASASTPSTSGKKHPSSTAASKRKAADDASSSSHGASKVLKTEEGQTTKK